MLVLEEKLDLFMLLLSSQSVGYEDMKTEGLFSLLLDVPIK
jgi:hypothetical protein